MKDAFEKFPVALLFLTIEATCSILLIFCLLDLFMKATMHFLWGVFITSRKKNAHVGALGTLSSFLQAFPAASKSEISFVEWSQGVHFFVYVNSCIYPRWHAQKQTGNLVCFCERTYKLYLNCACNTNRPFKEKLKFMC